MMSSKNVLITGCSKGGVGDALAQLYHRRGHAVIATARDLAKAEHLVAMGVTVVQLDVVNAISVKAAFKFVNTLTGGSLDILVNNSGGGYNMPLLDSDVEVAKDIFEVNVFGLISVTKTFAPLLIEAKGTVVNIGSVAGMSPLPFQGWYNASKAAVNLLSDNLRLELAPFDITVICIAAGAVKSHFFDNIASTKLPANSYYQPNRDTIENAHQAQAKSRIETFDFAEQIVANSLKSSPQLRQWVGGQTTAVWFANTFLWHTVWDIFLPNRYGMGGLKEKLLSREKPFEA